MTEIYLSLGWDFFRIEWDYSLTGTTFNMQNELFDKINIPIVFNAVGVDIIDGNEKNIVKFRTFLENCARKQRCIISVRNDGSYDILKGICTNELMKKILKGTRWGILYKCKLLRAYRNSRKQKK